VNVCEFCTTVKEYNEATETGDLRSDEVGQAKYRDKVEGARD
jgi:hypothetical protein